MITVAMDLGFVATGGKRSLAGDTIPTLLFFHSPFPTNTAMSLDAFIDPEAIGGLKALRGMCGPQSKTCFRLTL